MNREIIYAWDAWVKFTVIAILRIEVAEENIQPQGSFRATVFLSSASNNCEGCTRFISASTQLNKLDLAQDHVAGYSLYIKKAMGSLTSAAINDFLDLLISASIGTPISTLKAHFKLYLKSGVPPGGS